MGFVAFDRKSKMYAPSQDNKNTSQYEGKRVNVRYLPFSQELEGAQFRNVCSSFRLGDGEREQDLVRY